MGMFRSATRTTLVWVVFILVIQTGCSTFPPANINVAGGAESMVKACTPTAFNLGNPYRVSAGADDRNARFSQAIYDNFQKDVAGSRDQALVMLGVQTKKWSNFKDIQIDGLSYRILAVYLHPDLIRAIVLNQLISTNDKTVNFSNKVRDALYAVSNREEAMFFFIVMPANMQGSVDTGKEVVGNVKPSHFHLENTAGEQSSPLHAERMMEHPINLSSGFGSALAGYPIFIIRANNDCGTFLDPLFDTKLVMHMAGGTIGGQDLNEIVFPVPVTAALQVTEENPDVEPNISSISNDLLQRGRPLDQPPSPSNWQGWSDTQRLLYWIDIGRFLWADLTQSTELVNIVQQ